MAAVVGGAGVGSSVVVAAGVTNNYDREFEIDYNRCNWN